MKIGNVEIKSPSFVLAPMCAINCTSHRLLAKKHNCSLVYTQMINSNIHYNKTLDEMKRFLNVREEERPITIQISGRDKEKVLKTLKLVEQIADIIDYNSGCITPQILERNEGAAMLKEQDLLIDIVKSMVDNSKIPVTVKMRIGWDNQTISGVKLAKRLKETGISGLAIHGRTAEQKYGGKANWMIQKQIKEIMGKDFPVIYNGDIDSYEKGIEMLEKTGCDAVMVGRRAINAPWIFNKDFKYTNENILNEILDFIDMYLKYENREHVNEVREHVFWMFRDVKVPGGINPRDIHKLKTIEEIRDFIRMIRDAVIKFEKSADKEKRTEIKKQIQGNIENSVKDRNYAPKSPNKKKNFNKNFKKN